MSALGPAQLCLKVVLRSWTHCVWWQPQGSVLSSFLFSFYTHIPIHIPAHATDTQTYISSQPRGNSRPNMQPSWHLPWAQRLTPSLSKAEFPTLLQTSSSQSFLSLMMALLLFQCLGQNDLRIILDSCLSFSSHIQFVRKSRGLDLQVRPELLSPFRYHAE